MSTPPDFSETPWPLPSSLPRNWPQRWPLKAWLALLAVGFAVMNVSLRPMMERSRPDDFGALWGTFCMGSIGGQAGLLAIGAVLGPFSTLRRHLVIIPVAAALALAWLLGVILSREMHGHYGPSLKSIIAVLLVLPLLFSFAELPLWMVRTFFRWRIESLADTSTRLPQLSIAGILAATAAVGLALGAIRLGQKLGNFHESDGWVGVAIAAGFTAGISAFVLPMVTAMIFRNPSPMVGTLVSTAWISLLGVVLVAVICAFAGAFPSREMHLLLSLLMGFIVTLTGPLAVVRRFGYRLLWGREAAH
jgi:hypothetical protein